MKLHLGPPPHSLADDELASGQWHRAPQPPMWLLQLFIMPLTGAFFAVVFLTASIGLNPKAGRGDSPASHIASVMITALLLGLLIRIASQPGFGLSPKSVIGFWPSRLALFTMYHGKISKQRYVWQLVAPFLLLSVVPLVAAVVFKPVSGWPIFVSCWTAFLFGWDSFLAASVALVLPTGSIMAGRGFQLYWCRGDNAGNTHATR